MQLGDGVPAEDGGLGSLLAVWALDDIGGWHKTPDTFSLFITSDGDKLDRSTWTRLRFGTPRGEAIADACMQIANEQLEMSL